LIVGTVVVVTGVYLTNRKAFSQDRPAAA